MSEVGGVVTAGCMLLVLVAIVLLFQRDSRRQAKEYSSAINRFAKEWMICDVSGVFVHKHFMHLLREEFASEQRIRPALRKEDNRLFVIVFDLDDFKKVNDRFGHLAGNEVLSFFGSVLREELRVADMIGRFGGDEFIVSGHCSCLATGEIAKRIAKAFRANHFHWNGRKIRLTVSVGFSVLEPGDKSPEDIINRADKALFAVKRQGKNGLGFADSTTAFIELFDQPRKKI
jgi:diguanylate cyclase (GGDEF)-like protein